MLKGRGYIIIITISFSEGGLGFASVSFKIQVVDMS